MLLFVIAYCMEDSQKSMHGISFVEVLCVTKGTPNVQRASSNFCNPLLRTTDFIRLKARVTACSSKHKTLLRDVGELCAGRLGHRGSRAADGDHEGRFPTAARLRGDNP